MRPNLEKKKLPWDIKDGRAAVHPVNLPANRSYVNQDVLKRTTEDPCSVTARKAETNSTSRVSLSIPKVFNRTTFTTKEGLEKAISSESHRATNIDFNTMSTYHDCVCVAEEKCFYVVRQYLKEITDFFERQFKQGLEKAHIETSAENFTAFLKVVYFKKVHFPSEVAVKCAMTCEALSIPVIQPEHSYLDISMQRHFRKHGYFFHESTIPHDRVLLVKNTQFYVFSKHLAFVSPYFNNLFNGDCKDAEKPIRLSQSEVSFNDFLTLLYGRELLPNAVNVREILRMVNSFETSIPVNKFSLLDCAKFAVLDDLRFVKSIVSRAVMEILPLPKMKCVCFSEKKERCTGCYYSVNEFLTSLRSYELMDIKTEAFIFQCLLDCAVCNIMRHKTRHYNDLRLKWDCVVNVGNNSFNIVSQDLSKVSHFFYRLFDKGSLKERTEKYRINDVSSSSFEKFLNFLYIDEVFDVSDLPTILNLCDRFEADLVKRRCESILVRKLSSYNFFVFHNIATFSNFADLQAKLLDMLKMPPVRSNSSTIPCSKCHVSMVMCSECRFRASCLNLHDLFAVRQVGGLGTMKEKITSLSDEYKSSIFKCLMHFSDISPVK